MEHQGPNNPSIAANDTTVGNSSWASKNNVFASDNARAYSILGLDDITYYLKATGFGFSIPPGSEIKGIVVQIEKQQSPGTIKDYSVKIVKNNVISGSEKGKTTDVWPGTDAYITYGGENNLWGLSWTADDINNANFGVVISAKCFDEGANARIDHIKITVYYIPVDQRSTKGYKDPGTVVNDASIGTVAWSNPNNAKVSDDTYATAVLGASVISNYLKATNFGFQLADDIIVKGIKVLIEKKASAAAKIKDYEVKLVKGGVIQATNKAQTSFWSIYDEYSEYGGKTDLWDQTWTPADINASNFGMVITAKNEDTGNITASIDHICIAVYYSYSTPPIPESFQKLMEQPESEKVYLVEIFPALEMTDWQSYGSGIYYQSWMEKHINEPAEIIKIEEDGVELTEKASFADMEAAQGSWYLGDYLYVHTSDDGNANNKTMLVYTKLRFASQPKIFNNRFYFPRVKKQGIPALGTESRDIFSFETSVGGGNIRLLNADEFFDKIYRTYIWKNKEVKVLIGGEELTYLNYRLQFVGKIQDSSYSDREMEFILRDVRVDLHRKLPLNKYYLSDYPNMNPDAEGKSIPLVWGDVHNITATIIDSTVQKGKYKIADHVNALGDTLYAIDAVYSNGVQINGTHLTFDLVNGEFTILNSYSGTPGTVTCDVRGRKDNAEGSITGYADALITKAADIITDVCTNLLGLEKLNTEEFEEARLDAPQELAVFIGEEEYSNKIIEKVCQSVMGHFVIGTSGFIHFNIWSDEVPDDVVVLQEEDLLSFREICEIEEIFKEIIVKYDQDPTTNEYKAVQKSDETVEYKYNRTINKEIETYLKQTNDANNLADDILDESNKEQGKYEVETKLKAIELKVGDKIKISRSRAPSSSGKFEGKVFRVLSVSKDISNMRTRLILLED